MRGAFRNFLQVAELLCMQTRTSGGSSETDTNELADMPAGSPSTMAQIAVTPEGNNRRRSGGSGDRRLRRCLPKEPHP